ncbi:aminoglycoside phosphotransferase family protein [Paenibacillus hexagrammi]|uniref:Aminoglycoside phosphotransferase family protein n=1 Tax=Paenibacillus hexagrammi TaxID=2908839 RepID=A0ABY3SCH9_9BACL|nr:aminoglycoside phosphotransferase family protein [Paenibacillus sp. YPD9-1]UJF31694.1 aminoglycoside phosphotransferase family protein [Paenibacillus sp. YPD9-1]
MDYHQTAFPEAFRRTILGVYKEQGRQWLDGFPQLIKKIEETHKLHVLGPYPLSYHFVAPVIMGNGTKAVIKLAVSGREMASEAAVLMNGEGIGMVKLIEHDAALGMMIMEKLEPGHTLAGISDDENAVRIAASVMSRIWKKPSSGHSFQFVTDWFQGYGKLRSRFHGGTGSISTRMVELAERRFSELVRNPRNIYLLHGDLHHGNILAAEREPWLAIDPKGVLGEREYEVIPYLMNHVPEERAIEATKRRVELFAELLQLDASRILLWAYCHAVLSAWWHIEDETGGEEASISAAERFDRLIQGGGTI